MPRKKQRKKRQLKRVGVEAVVEPGVGALYVRGAWMKKLKNLDERKKAKYQKSSPYRKSAKKK